MEAGILFHVAGAWAPIQSPLRKSKQKINNKNKLKLKQKKTVNIKNRKKAARSRLYQVTNSLNCKCFLH